MKIAEREWHNLSVVDDYILRIDLFRTLKKQNNEIQEAFGLSSSYSESHNKLVKNFSDAEKKSFCFPPGMNGLREIINSSHSVLNQKK